MNANQIFEVNVINNLERESILVQIQSDLNLKWNGLNPYQTTTMGPLPMPIPIGSHLKPTMPIGPIPIPIPNINLKPLKPTINTIPISSQYMHQNNNNQRYINQHRHTINGGHSLEQKVDKKVVVSDKKVDNNVVPTYNNNVYPGFVRIAPFQSLPMPVIISRTKRVGAFLTIYVEDSVSSKTICLANQLQINRQNIEIKRSSNGNIVIKAICYTQNQIDNLLYSWSIPQYLCNSMKNAGWDNISLWHEITETDLIEMGFQRGHRLIFFDKFTELLRTGSAATSKSINGMTIKHNNFNFSAIYTKYILKAWNLPIYLYSNMMENGWIDPSDWGEITDYHFKKMGFKDGHIVKFRKQIKNNHHLIAFQKMKSEQLLSEHKAAAAQNASATNINTSSINPQTLINNLNQNIGACPQPNVNNLTFKIDPTTITHEQFWYTKLDEIKPNETYYLETKHGNNPWQQREEITDTKRRNICELDMDTTYFIRIKSENKRTNKITYSPIVEVKTKDEKWKNTHLPKIPDFTYAVSSNNKQITVEFDPKSLKQIKQTKFDERYSLDIGLSKDNGLERIVNWKNVATLRKDKLVYKYNVNDQKDADWVHVGISARNDLGQRYNQCTRTRQFPFNQVIKRINTTKHGNNLQFDESMTVATKIDQDYQYSTFAFGQPVTREMCNRYDMYVKVNKLKSDCFMGFAPSLESVIDWNQALGYGGNKNSSVGVLANKLSADFAVYNKDEDKRFIYHAAGGINEKKWDDGSVFLLSFDFLNDDCNIYLNENNPNDFSQNDHNTLDQNRLLKSIKLNQIKSVVPSFSLNSQGDSIQVVKWRLY